MARLLKLLFDFAKTVTVWRQSLVPSQTHGNVQAVEYQVYFVVVFPALMVQTVHLVYAHRTKKWTIKTT